MKKFIYEFGFSDPECSWSHYFKHKKKYTQKEIKIIIEDITENYKLLIALKVLNMTTEENYLSETFEYWFDYFLYDQCLKEYDGTIEINDMLFNKADVFGDYTKEVIQILEEIYGFEYYKVPLEASVYLSW